MNNHRRMGKLLALVLALAVSAALLPIADNSSYALAGQNLTTQDRVTDQTGQETSQNSDQAVQNTAAGTDASTSQETAAGTDASTSQEAAAGTDASTSQEAAAGTDASTSQESAAGSDASTSQEAAAGSDASASQGTAQESAADQSTANSQEKAAGQEASQNSDQAAKNAADVSASQKVAPVVRSTTKISGYKTYINKRYSQSISFSAKITPAKGGRKVRLQRYNSGKGKWVTIKTYTTKSAKTATVKISIDRKYRKKTNAKWRIHVDATETAKAANSKTIRVITRNLKSVRLSAKSACIYRIDGDGKGTAIMTKNSTDVRAQASTTKLMSAILVMESGKAGKKTKITDHAASTPWGSGMLKSGDTYYVKDLMYAMLMPSSNDAATALSETVGGTETDFVKMMNAKAKEFGLSNTSYCNPHGLDASGHHTTALELARLTAYAYRYPLISDIWNTRVKTIQSIKYKRNWTLWSTNAIFGYDKYFKGGKTGTTGNAGCCFTGIYEYGGETYVTTVLGSGYGFSRWLDTKKLHSYIRDYAGSKY